MTHVVTKPCFGCKHQQCVQECPADCFHEGEQMVYIDPDACIDCDACVHVCPEQAIYYEEDVPEEWRGFIPLNEEMSKTTPIAMLN